MDGDFGFFRPILCVALIDIKARVADVLEETLYNFVVGAVVKVQAADLSMEK